MKAGIRLKWNNQSFPHLQDYTGFQKERVYATVLEGMCDWMHYTTSEKNSWLLLLLFSAENKQKKTHLHFLHYSGQKDKYPPFAPITFYKSLFVKLHTV